MTINNPYAGPGENLPVKMSMSMDAWRKNMARAWDEGRESLQQELAIETLQRSQADCPGWGEDND